jgi:ABC-type transport system involved in Fe-S cluster assembly fused permease/ATPase subunit
MIVEAGNHESLLDIEGVYSKLWSVQTGEKIN